MASFEGLNRFRLLVLTGAADEDRRRPQRAHLQLRHTEEQVKYSSGKKWTVSRSSEISPQKRSLRACGDNRVGGVHCFLEKISSNASKVAGHRTCWQHV